MEESDLLLQIRTSFHLGNNYKVIELLKEHSDVTLTSNKDLASSILCRSIVKMGKNFVKYVEGLNIQALKGDIQLSFDYLGPLNQEVRTFLILQDFLTIYRSQKKTQQNSMISSSQA